MDKVRQRKMYTRPYNKTFTIYVYVFLCLNLRPLCLIFCHQSLNLVQLWSILQLPLEKNMPRREFIFAILNLINRFINEDTSQLFISTFLSFFLSFLFFLSVNASFCIIVTLISLLFFFTNTRHAFHGCDFYLMEDYLWIVSADIRLIVRAREDALYAYRIRLLITRLRCKCHRALNLCKGHYQAGHLGSTVHRAIRIRLNCAAREGPSYLHALSIKSDDNIISRREESKKKRCASSVMTVTASSDYPIFFFHAYVDDTWRYVVRRGSLFYGKPLKVAPYALLRRASSRNRVIHLSRSVNALKRLTALRAVHPHARES